MSITINNNNYHALIFDLDDTLIDTSQSYDAAIKQTVQHYTQTLVDHVHLNLVRTKGISYGVNNDWNVSWLLITLIRQLPMERWEEALVQRQLPSIDVQSSEYLAMKDFFQAIYLGKPPFSGQGLIDVAEKRLYADNFFSTLKRQQIHLAIVTSRPTAEALYTLKNINGIVNEFISQEELIISLGSRTALGELIAEKPHPQPILECVKRLHLPINECAYVGNSTSDYLAARDAGVAFIQVGKSYIQRSQEPKGFSYLKLQNVNELLQIF